MKKGKILSWNLQCDTLRHTVNPFIRTSLHSGIHSKESLVWFEGPLTLLPHQKWTPKRTLPETPVAALCFGDPDALGPQDHPILIRPHPTLSDSSSGPR